MAQLPQKERTEFQRAQHLIAKYAKLAGYEVTNGSDWVRADIPNGGSDTFRVYYGTDHVWSLYNRTDSHRTVKAELESAEVRNQIVYAIAYDEVHPLHRAEKEQRDKMTTTTTTDNTACPLSGLPMEPETKTKKGALHRVLKVGRRSIRGSAERVAARRLNRQLIKALRKMTPADQQHVFDAPAAKLFLPFIAPTMGLFACEIVNAQDSKTWRLAHLASERALDGAFDDALKTIEPLAWKLVKEFARAARVNDLVADLDDNGARAHRPARPINPDTDL